MTRIAFLIVLAAGLFSSHAYAECRYPKAPPRLPDGNTATEQEMVDAMKTVKQYDKDVNDYLACLDAEAQTRIQEAGPDAPQEHIQQIRQIQSKRHNAAVEQLQTHAAEFNEQVRAFKNKSKS